MRIFWKISIIHVDLWTLTVRYTKNVVVLKLFVHASAHERFNDFTVIAVFPFLDQKKGLGSQDFIGLGSRTLRSIWMILSN